MEFKNNGSKTFFRLYLQSGKEHITAQATSGLYSEIQSPSVEWSEDAFPLREWSHLAVYDDGGHLVVAQRQDAAAAAVRVSLDKHASTNFRIVSNGNVTYNCMKGHNVTSVSELLQVSEDKTYCLQAAGPPVTLSGGNAPLIVANATWHRIQEQAGSYSVSGVIFVIENCSANAFMSTALTTEVSTTTSEEATTIPTTALTNPTTTPTTDLTNPTTTPTTDLTNPTTHQPEQSESSLLPTTSSRPRDAGTPTPGEMPTGPSEGPSAGAVAAVVITLIILLLTVTLFIKRGYHREVIMMWHNATHREEQPVEIINLQKGSSLRQKEDNV